MLKRLLIIAVVAWAATGQGFAQSTPQEAYVRAVVVAQEALSKAQTQSTENQASTSAELSALREQLQAVQTELLKLRDQADKNEPEAKLALQALSEGHSNEAFDILERRTQKDEQAAFDGWVQIGILAIGFDTSRSISAFENAVKIRPSDSTVRLYLAEAYSFQGRYDAAYASADTAILSAKPGYELLEALNSAARLRIMAGNLGGAGPYFDRYFEERERIPVKDVTVGVIEASFRFETLYGGWLMLDSRLDRAMSFYDKSIPYLQHMMGDKEYAADAAPALISLLADATLVSVRLGKEAEAEKYSKSLSRLFSEASKQMPGNFQLLMMSVNAKAASANVELRFGEATRAVSELRSLSKALQASAGRDPGNQVFDQTLAAVLTAQGWSELVSGQQQEAVASLKQAREVASRLYMVRTTDITVVSAHLSSLTYGAVAAWAGGDETEARELLAQSDNVYTEFRSLKKPLGGFFQSFWTVTALKVATRNPTEWEDFLARAKQFVEAGLLTDAEVAYARQIRDRLQKTYPALPR